MTKPKELTSKCTFSEMIEKSYLYVDKTEHIYQLFKGGMNYYFLARPRRFGKSLLISTLKELFAGNKKLFEGLWIEKSDWEWKQHPVIHLDFSKIAHQNPDDLKKSLHVHIGQHAIQYNINLTGLETIEDKVSTLIVEASKKNKVVLLIDEYDKPIIDPAFAQGWLRRTDHINNIEIAEQNRSVLKSFYKEKDLKVTFVQEQLDINAKS